MTQHNTFWNGDFAVNPTGSAHVSLNLAASLTAHYRDMLVVRLARSVFSLKTACVGHIHLPPPLCWSPDGES